MRKVLYFVTGLALMSCGDDKVVAPQNQNEDVFEEENITYTVKQIKELKTAAKVVYTLPSPVEMADLLFQTNAIYDVEILNDPDGIDDYVTDMTRSLNLGVYFADLSFTSMFDYPLDAMKFMGSAQALSSELNIEGVFTEEIRMKLEGSTNNKDSLMDIIATTYMETDLYLQENDRPIVSKAILTGAWIEGLYIAVNLQLDKGKEMPVWESIAEQKPALSNLINMLKNVKGNDFDNKISQLEELEVLFNSVDLNYENETEVKTDTVNKITTLSAKLEVVITKKSFDAIKSKVSSIRNEITN
jgi:hypothetical protein